MIDLKKNLIQHNCFRCGYSWLSKMENPKVCSRCKNWRWNIPTKKRMDRTIYKSKKEKSQ